MMIESIDAQCAEHEGQFKDYRRCDRCDLYGHIEDEFTADNYSCNSCYEYLSTTQQSSPKFKVGDRVKVKPENGLGCPDAKIVKDWGNGIYNTECSHGSAQHHANDLEVFNSSEDAKAFSDLFTGSTISSDGVGTIQKLCSCDFVTVIMRTGCACGGK